MENQKPFKIYFDTEFTGLTQNTTLISIGMVTEDNNVFYAEFTDYNKDMVSPWIEENVISRLRMRPENSSNFYSNHFIYGNKNKIAKALIEWLSTLRRNHDNSIQFQFVSDVCHYDFMLLIDLIVKNALELPDCISPYCHDINQDIANYFNITDYEAFNMNREEIIKNKIPNNHIFDELCTTNKHNSLWDAHVIRAIDQIMNNNSFNMNPDIFNIF